MTNKELNFEHVKNIWDEFSIKTSIIDDSYVYKLLDGILEKESTFESWVRILGHFSDKNVLDIGCGNGFLSFLISYYAIQVSGIDKEHKYIILWDLLHSLFNRKNVIFKIEDGSLITPKSLRDRNINAIFMCGLRPDFQEEGINFLYKQVIDAKVDIIIASKYSHHKKNEEIYKRNIEHYLFMKNYEVIDNNSKLMVLRKNVTDV